MKKIALMVILLVTSAIVTAQQLYVEGGKTMSSFDYKNSQGERLNNLQSTTHSLMEIGYRNQLFTKKMNLSLGANYVGYGAIGSDDIVGNFMEWNVNYAGLNFGLDYQLFKIKKASFYLKGVISAEFFIQGTQTLNTSVINLKNKDDFDKTLFDFRAGFGFLHPISEKLFFYVQYMGGKSFNLKEGKANTSDKEELRILNNTISFGLLINISKK